MKKKITVVFALVFLFLNEVMADPLTEYGDLLNHLKNYNTLGFFIINDANSWQRNPLLHTDLDIISLVPLDRGFFQFIDRETEKPIYGRNAILSVNAVGIVCNIDGYPVYPIIEINRNLSYTLSYRDKKLIVEYPQENIIEEHDIFLYWPAEMDNNSLYGVYFYFEDVDILHDDQILSGYIDTSSVNIQLTLVKMMKLVTELHENNTNSVVYGAGSAEATLAILQSLLSASYTVEIDPPIYYRASEERQRLITSVPGILPERVIELPVRVLNIDPLKLAFLYEYLIITEVDATTW
jgi:hypothetical protein